jgi:hypothetical protein
VPLRAERQVVRPLQDAVLRDRLRRRRSLKLSIK